MVTVEKVGQYTCACCLATTCLSTLIFIIVVLCSIHTLSQDEQIIVHSPNGWFVRNGPWKGVLDPSIRKTHRDANLLQENEYAIVKHIRSGARTVHTGPQLLFIGAYEETVTVAKKVVLQSKQYARIKNILNGSLENLNGPAVLAPGPYDEVLSVQEKTVLQPMDYAIVKNNLTGVKRNEEGPQLLFVGPYDEVLEIKQKIVLQRHEYARLADLLTGIERVLTGPANIVPQPSEQIAEGVQRGVFVDKDTAVLVLERTTGKQRLITTKGVFIPTAVEEVLETRELIHVEPHEAMVVREPHGNLVVYNGQEASGGSIGGEGMAFFLPPYCAIVSMTWSSHTEGGETSQRTLEKIDLRVQKVFFNYEMRTSDNVKLRLQGTIFWRIGDVRRMVNATSDPEGDVYHRSRSVLIQAVSRVKFAEFMEGFNDIVVQAFNAQKDSLFYLKRGVEVESMEVTKFEAVDEETAKVLQEIIRETTNRINRLQAQHSQNEVNQKKLDADILLERSRTQLIKAQAENERLKAERDGEAGGVQLAKSASTFLDELNASLPNISKRVELYKLHEKLKNRNNDTAALAGGQATLFLSPEDMDLQLGRVEM